MTNNNETLLKQADKNWQHPRLMYYVRQLNFMHIANLLLFTKIDS